MQLNPKIAKKIAPVHWLRQETGCTRASAADTFDLQQVNNGVHGCVQAGANGPDFYRCYGEDQWHILPSGAFDSKATACYA